MCKLDHVAIATTKFEETKELFKKIGMNIDRETGTIPTRQLWFYEGIQLKEVASMEHGTNVDHIALGTNDIEKTARIALSNGCSPDERGRNWFTLPNGTAIELMRVEE